MSHWKQTLPSPPYYAVIFISTRSKELQGYAEMDELTIRLATADEGFIGYESIKSGDNGIFISYWKDMESINRWKNDPIHQEAKKQGYSKWYDRFITQVCKVESGHEFIRKE